ncbi:MAG: DNA-binding response regulator [Chloroflexi bacterium]|nr:MAG: DNA-binding response regulator [Chloroflexota bacterium]
MGQNNSIKVVIADDHPVVRIGIKYHLGLAPGISIVGEAANGLEAIQLVKELSPDVLIVDLRMPLLDGVQVLARLHTEMPGLFILVISEDDDACQPKDTLAMGASGHFLKSQDPRSLIKAVRQAAGGEEQSLPPNQLLSQKADWDRGPLSFA